MTSYPSRFHRLDARIFDAQLPNNSRVSFLWNANEHPSVNIGYGVAAMATKGFKKSLKRLLGAGPKARPDAVVLNSGLHDLFCMTDEGSFERYEGAVRRAMVMVARITDLPVWRQTSPKRREFECGGYGPQPFTGHVNVQRVNKIAARVAAENGFRVFDITQFNLALYDSGDRHHCWQTQPCDLFALSFFNLFHEQWGNRNHVPAREM